MRQALIGCLLTAVVVILALAGGAALYLYAPFGLSGLFGFDVYDEGPPEGVHVGEGLFAKRSVKLDGRINWVTDILRTDLDGRPGLDLGVASAEGILYLDSEYNQLRYAPIVEYVDNIRFVQVPSRNENFVYNNQSWYEDDALALFDLSGKQLWTFENPNGPAAMAPGDLDGDGEPEFCVIYSDDESEDSETLLVLDASGNELWRKAIPYTWDFEVADITGDGLDDICVFDETDEVFVERREGERQRVTTDPVMEASVFTTVAWPANESGAKNICLEVFEGLYIIDSDGNPRLDLDAPGLDYPDDIRAEAFTLEPGGPAHLAVIANCFYPEYTQFYVYDPDGALIYYEVLGSYTSALTPIYTESGECRILLGGDDCFYEYTLAAALPEDSA